MFTRSVLIAVPLFLLAACAMPRGANKQDLAADAARAQFTQLQSLEGTWKTSPGAPMEATVSYNVVAAGSAVEERLFPGFPHEMITLYHMDGDALVLTHYCAAGNQPHMRAVPTSDGSIHFAFVGLSNGDPAKGMHMHEGTLRVGTDGHLRSEWIGWQDGKPGEHTVTFDLVRAE